MNHIIITLLIFLISACMPLDKEMYEPPQPDPYAKTTIKHLNNRTIQIIFILKYETASDIEIYPKHETKPGLVIFNRDTVVYNYDEPGKYKIYGKCTMSNGIEIGDYEIVTIK